MNTIKIKAFSLVELMIVIAIIGVLAAIAIPSYQDYVVRAKFVEGLHILNDLKTEVSNYYLATESFPTDLNGIRGGLTGSTYNNGDITSIGMSTGGCGGAGSLAGDWCMYLRYSNNLTGIGNNGGALILIATVANGVPNWQCATDMVGRGTSIPQRLLPSSCIQPTS